MPVWPFSFGSAIGVSMGLEATNLIFGKAGGILILEILPGMILCFAYMLVTEAILLALFLLIRRGCTKDCLTAVSDIVAFISGTCFGVLAWPLAWLSARYFGGFFYDREYNILLMPFVGAIGGAIGLVRRMRID